MGALITVFEACGGDNNGSNPAQYMDMEMERESRFKNGHKKRVDVMGSAMDAAMHDVKYYIGLNMSDAEETAENDDDYLDMAALKEKYLKKIKKEKGDSDKSMNKAYGERGEDLYKVRPSTRINSSIGVP
jgi:hypothetical protein